MTFKRVIIILFISLSVFYALFFVLPIAGTSGVTKVIDIEDGASVSTIAIKLTENNILFHNYFLISFVKIFGSANDIKAGRYEFSGKLSINQLYNMLTLGGRSGIKIVIPEGFNVNDIDSELSRAGLIKKGDLLNSKLINLEGYLFPDTYYFNSGSSIEDIISVFVANFYKKLLSIDISKEDISSRLYADPLYRIDDKNREYTIVASMLEKEVRSEDDMRLVSGIIQNRLEAGMPLQIDATTAYGVCRQQFLKGSPCEVSEVPIRTHLADVNKYNTYKVSGLPAGPISNPGLRALNSAKNPEKNNYFYYFTDSSGKVYYSKTFEEHLEKLKIYR